MKHALQNRHVLENKESNAVTWKDKQKCWLNITELYNSETTGCVRIEYYYFLHALNSIVPICYSQEMLQVYDQNMNVSKNF